MAFYQLDDRLLIPKLYVVVLKLGCKDDNKCGRICLSDVGVEMIVLWMVD